MAQVHPADSDNERFITVISNPVDGDMHFHEYVDWLAAQEWYTKYNFHQRLGMGIMGGSLLGVSTALARVYDKNDNATDGECFPHEGASFARFYDKEHPEGAPHKSKVVWDAPHCAAVAEAVGRGCGRDRGQRTNLALDDRSRPQDTRLLEQYPCASGSRRRTGR